MFTIIHSIAAIIVAVALLGTPTAIPVILVAAYGAYMLPKQPACALAAIAIMLAALFTAMYYTYGLSLTVSLAILYGWLAYFQSRAHA